MDFYGGFTVVDVLFHRLQGIFCHVTVIFGPILSKFGPNLNSGTSEMANFRPFFGDFLSFSRKFSKNGKIRISGDFDMIVGRLLRTVPPIFVILSVRGAHFCVFVKTSKLTEMGGGFT